MNDKALGSTGSEPRYSAGPIVPQDAFLRRLPHFLNKEQRIRLDALVFSADIIEDAYLRIREVALHCGTDGKKFEGRARLAMFAAAWTIVDHLHACRQFVRSLSTPGPIGARFLALSEPAQILRNKMDHLNQNVRNLAKTKEVGPLYGSLSYALLGKATDGPEGLKLHSLEIAMVPAGMVRGSGPLPAVNPAGLPFAVPVDHFMLSAFGITIEFPQVIGCLVEWLTKTNEALEGELTAAGEKLAEEHGRKVEEMMSPEGLTFTAFMTLSFDKPEGDDPVNPAS